MCIFMCIYIYRYVYDTLMIFLDKCVGVGRLLYCFQDIDMGWWVVRVWRTIRVALQPS